MDQTPSRRSPHPSVGPGCLPEALGVDKQHPLPFGTKCVRGLFTNPGTNLAPIRQVKRQAWRRPGICVKSGYVPCHPKDRTRGLAPDAPPPAPFLPGPGSGTPAGLVGWAQVPTASGHSLRPGRGAERAGRRPECLARFALKSEFPHRVLGFGGRFRWSFCEVGFSQSESARPGGAIRRLEPCEDVASCDSLGGMGWGVLGPWEQPL